MGGARELNRGSSIPTHPHERSAGRAPPDFRGLPLLLQRASAGLNINASRRAVVGFGIDTGLTLRDSPSRRTNKDNINTAPTSSRNH